MFQTSSSTLLDRSRLVGLLTELSPSKLNTNDYNLAERLGHLIGLSGSITLAQTFRQTPSGSYSAGERGANNVAEEVQSKVLQARQQLMQKIADSFDHDKVEPANKVPTANVAIRASALLSYDPYQRFYSSYQVEIGVEVQNLRAMVRTIMSEVSASLHQLAELDTVLENSLNLHNRRLFSVTPKLLEKHFQRQLAKRPQTDSTSEAIDDIDDWLQPGAWLEQFYRDMCELLFAEFDVRLQPVFGLLEALKEHTKTTS